MKRGQYIGHAGVLGGSGYPSIPIQTETTAYLSRFTTAPSTAYRNALNQFIYDCKQNSVLSLVQDLFLFCADTQADGLRNYVNTARDATITGALTFTALKGLSGFGASNHVDTPLDLTGVTVAAAAPFAAFITSTTTAAGALNGATGTGPLSLVSAAVGAGFGCSFNGNNFGGFTQPGGGNQGFVVGTLWPGSANITPNAAGVNSGATASGAITSPILWNQTGLVRLSVFGQLAPTVTGAQFSLFMSALQTFISKLGAVK